MTASKGHESAVALAVDPVGAVDAGLGHLLREGHRALARSLQAQIATHGVSMGQWFFLRALWDEDGLTQRELSQRVGMMEPTTVTAINSMEHRGFVRRMRNPHDRRKVNIFLTPKGRALKDVLLPCAVEVARIAVQGVQPPDLVKAAQVLRQMLGNLEGQMATTLGTAAGHDEID
ncbi:MarR family winged helix-turn-helix transcriptional regulator [Oleisolibacter albus]|uniref:MarR family winged helix-turn-helix transcriptional regulator n=1 Tax=Oleisolibacter albus TaxID=2171757 RepID=UPI000DF1BC0C|nr:MarR family transcriptional regulator [Oleisolibacter albus]